MNTEEKIGSGVLPGTMSRGRNWLNFKVNQAALAYAMTTVGAAMINNIFSFYYVKLFINKYQTSETAFHQSQVRKSFLYIYSCYFNFGGTPVQPWAWGRSAICSCQRGSFLHSWCSWCGMRSTTLSLATCKTTPGCVAALSAACPSCMELHSTR